jgi:Outer membrane protein beta-barrel domain
MKRIILTAILIAIFGATQAQGLLPDGTRIFEGGIILGANIAKVDDLDDFSNFHRLGFNTGGIVYVHFTPHFCMSMELLYSRKGSYDVHVTSSVALSTYIGTYDLKLDYAEVPIMLHYMEGKMDYELGLSYGRLFSTSEYIYYDPPITVDPVLNAFNKEDYDLIFGLSRKLNKYLTANVRWQCSVTPIRPLERLPLLYPFDGQMNNVFCLRLIYML